METTSPQQGLVNPKAWHRHWLLAAWILTALFVTVMTSCTPTEADSVATTEQRDESSEPEADTDTASDDPEIDRGFGSADASGDVELVGCEIDETFGWGEAKVLVTNNSSETSRYRITVAFENEDQTFKFNDGTGFEENLRPGQSTEVSVSSFDEITEDFVCTITAVERLAE